MYRTEEILRKVDDEKKLSREEIIYLLGLKDEQEREKLYKKAREVREKYFGNKLFTYGFVYFSTYCKNDCTFCYYRKSNNLCDRYRKDLNEILSIAKELKAQGVNLIDLTMGEDPIYHCNGKEGIDKLLKVIKKVKNELDMPIMVSPGVISESTINKLVDIGAEWYACYQEIHNVEKYNKLRLNQDYNTRLNAKEYAKKSGMLIEEGILVGVGNTLEDIVDSFEEMERMNADQVRVMTFVPQEGTPLSETEPLDSVLELNIIAVMRILFNDKLIPASLDVEGLVGLEGRLNAGASVVTSIIPPNDGLRGVSQSTLDVDSANRTIGGIKSTVERCGLELATTEEYKEWIYKRMGAKREAI